MKLGEPELEQSAPASAPAAMKLGEPESPKQEEGGGFVLNPFSTTFMPFLPVPMSQEKAGELNKQLEKQAQASVLGAGRMPVGLAAHPVNWASAKLTGKKIFPKHPYENFPEARQVIEENQLPYAMGQFTTDLTALGAIGRTLQAARFPELLKFAYPVADKVAKYALPAGKKLLEAAKTPVGKFVGQKLLEAPGFVANALIKGTAAAANFGALSALKGVSEQDKLTKISADVGKSALWGFGLGPFEALPHYAQRAAGAASYAFATTKMSGGDDIDATLNAGLMASFQLIGGKNVDRAMKAQALGSVREAMHDYFYKKTMDVNMSDKMTNAAWSRFLKNISYKYIKTPSQAGIVPEAGRTVGAEVELTNVDAILDNIKSPYYYDYLARSIRAINPKFVFPKTLFLPNKLSGDIIEKGPILPKDIDTLRFAKKATGKPVDSYRFGSFKEAGVDVVLENEAGQIVPNPAAAIPAAVREDVYKVAEGAFDNLAIKVGEKPVTYAKLHNVYRDIIDTQVYKLMAEAQIGGRVLNPEQVSRHIAQVVAGLKEEPIFMLERVGKTDDPDGGISPDDTVGFFFPLMKEVNLRELANELIAWADARQLTPDVLHVIAGRLAEEEILIGVPPVVKEAVNKLVEQILAARSATMSMNVPPGAEGITGGRPSIPLKPRLIPYTEGVMKPEAQVHEERETIDQRLERIVEEISKRMGKEVYYSGKIEDQPPDGVGWHFNTTRAALPAPPSEVGEYKPGVTWTKEGDLYYLKQNPGAPSVWAKALKKGFDIEWELSKQPVADSKLDYTGNVRINGQLMTKDKARDVILGNTMLEPPKALNPVTIFPQKMLVLSEEAATADLSRAIADKLGVPVEEVPVEMPATSEYLRRLGFDSLATEKWITVLDKRALVSPQVDIKTPDFIMHGKHLFSPKLYAKGVEPMVKVDTELMYKDTALRDAYTGERKTFKIGDSLEVWKLSNGKYWLHNDDSIYLTEQALNGINKDLDISTFPAKVITLTSYETDALTTAKRQLRDIQYRMSDVMDALEVTEGDQHNALYNELQRLRSTETQLVDYIVSHETSTHYGHFKLPGVIYSGTDIVEGNINVNYKEIVVALPEKTNVEDIESLARELSNMRKYEAMDWIISNKELFAAKGIDVVSEAEGLKQAYARELEQLELTANVADAREIVPTRYIREWIRSILVRMGGNFYGQHHPSIANTLSFARVSTDWSGDHKVLFVNEMQSIADADYKTLDLGKKFLDRNNISVKDSLRLLVREIIKHAVNNGYSRIRLAKGTEIREVWEMEDAESLYNKELPKLFAEQGIIIKDGGDIPEALFEKHWVYKPESEERVLRVDGDPNYPGLADPLDPMEKAIKDETERNPNFGNYRGFLVNSPVVMRDVNGVWRELPVGPYSFNEEQWRKAQENYNPRQELEITSGLGQRLTVPIEEIYRYVMENVAKMANLQPLDVIFTERDRTRETGSWDFGKITTLGKAIASMFSPFKKRNTVPIGDTRGMRMGARLAVRIAHMFDPLTSFKILDWTFGRGTLEKYFKPKTPQQVTDDFIYNVWADKRIKQLHLHTAEEQVKPLNDVVQKNIEKIYPKVGRTEKQFLHDVVNVISNFALQEVFVSPDKPGIVVKTRIGIGGKHIQGEKTFQDDPTSPGKAFVSAVKWLMDKLRIPEADLRTMWNVPPSAELFAYLQDNRPELAFFKLLQHANISGDDSIQLELLRQKEFESDIMTTLLEMGHFVNTNMWNNVARGYVNRVWTYKDQQHLGMDAQHNTFGSHNVPHAKYGTAEEFAYASGFWQKELLPALAEPNPQTHGSELVPLPLATISLQNYIVESLNTIQHIKMLRTILGMAVPGQSDKIPLSDKFKLACYRHSPEIQAEMKRAGDPTPDATLLRLGYIQGKGFEGLAALWRGAFFPPYIHASVYDYLQQMYDYKANGEIDKFIQIAEEFFAGPIKRFILSNPLDSAFVFASPLFIHMNLREITSRVLLPFAKIVGQTLSFKMFGKGGTGGKMLAGTMQPAYLSDDSLRRVPLILKHGFPLGFSNALFAITDKINSGKYANQQKGWERISEFALTAGGVNRAIYEQIILRGYVYLINKLADGYMKKYDLSEEEAIRRAVLFAEETSFLYNPDMWNRSVFWKAVWISRALTLGPLRQMVAMVSSAALKNPITEAWTKKIRQPRAGAFHTISNPIMLADKTSEDVEFLGARIGESVGRGMAWMFGVFAIVQFLLSFLDDDETGDKGNMTAPKRFIWNNPGIAKLFPRMPYKTQGDRVYGSPMWLREKRDQLMYLMSMSASWGKSAQSILSNKLNFIFDWFRAFVMGQDYRGEKIPGFDDRLPWKYGIKPRVSAATERLRILGTEPLVAADNETIGLRNVRRVANTFGWGEKRFPEVEPGMREVVIEPEDVYREPEERLKRWKQLAAINNYMSQMAIKNWQELPDEKLADELLKRGATEGQIKNILEQRQSKTAYWLKENASEVERGMMWDKKAWPVREKKMKLGAPSLMKLGAPEND